MGNYSNYTLLLGVKLNLEEKVIETNPKWKGHADKSHPSKILSEISIDDYWKMSDEELEKENTDYFYGVKNIENGYVLPDDSIVECLCSNGTFASESGCDLSRLCFISDSSWLEGEQLFGWALLYNSTSEGYSPGDEQKILDALKNKNKLADMINKYGFNFKPEDMTLHQFIMREG